MNKVLIIRAVVLAIIMIGSTNMSAMNEHQITFDDRLFKVIVSDGDYDVMTFSTPNDKENTLDNLKKLKEKGGCSQKHVDFYEKQLKDKKYKPQDMHCLIL